MTQADQRPGALASGAAPYDAATSTGRPPSRRVRRRVLLATGAVGVCAAGAAAVPFVAQTVTQTAETEAQRAFQAGLNAGKQAVLNDLAQLEGITIDGAIGVAEVTRLGVKYIVLPVARVVSFLGSNGLAGIAIGLTNAQENLARFNLSIGVLNSLQSIVSAWQQNLSQLPITLDAYAHTDIDGAETYLRALKKRIEAETTPTATPAR